MITDKCTQVRFLPESFMNKHISEACLWIRVMLGISRKSMSKLIGLSDATLDSCESGYPSLRTLEKYRQLTGIDVYLLASVKFCKSIDVPGIVEDAELKLCELSERVKHVTTH